MTLKRFISAIAMTCLIGMSAFAGETQGPSCAPGELGSPPCQVAMETSQDIPSSTDAPDTPSAEAFSATAEAVLKEMLAIW